MMKAAGRAAGYTVNFNNQKDAISSRSFPLLPGERPGAYGPTGLSKTIRTNSNKRGEQLVLYRIT
jgi:hypothetical protein